MKLKNTVAAINRQFGPYLKEVEQLSGPVPCRICLSPDRTKASIILHTVRAVYTTYVKDGVWMLPELLVRDATFEPFHLVFKPANRILMTDPAIRKEEELVEQQVVRFDAKAYNYELKQYVDINGIVGFFKDRKIYAKLNGNTFQINCLRTDRHFVDKYAMACDDPGLDLPDNVVSFPVGMPTSWIIARKHLSAASPAQEHMDPTQT